MVKLYLKQGGRVLKAAEDVIPRPMWHRIKQQIVTRTSEIPTGADLVLQVGDGAPEVKLEWWATQKGAWLCPLPEAGQYVSDRVRIALEDGVDLVLLDSGLRKLVA